MCGLALELGRLTELPGAALCCYLASQRSEVPLVTPLRDRGSVHSLWPVPETIRPEESGRKWSLSEESWKAGHCHGEAVRRLLSFTPQEAACKLGTFPQGGQDLLIRLEFTFFDPSLGPAVGCWNASNLPHPFERHCDNFLVG